MKRYAMMAFAVTMSGTALAQDAWDLNRCIDYAKQQNITIQRRKYDMQTAEVNLNTARNSRLPGVSASAGQNLDFGFTRTAVGTYSTQNTSSTSLGANASMMLYNGSYIRSRIKYSDWSLKAATEDINQMADDITVSVTLAYLQVLYNKELLSVAQENLTQSTEQVTKTEALVSGGRMPQSELFESKAQQAKDEYALTKAKSDLELSLLDLAQLMELTIFTGFDVVVPNVERIAISNDAVAALTSGSVESAFAIRPAIRAAEYRLQAGEENIRMMKAAYYPTLNLVGSYGNSYYYVMNPQTGYTNESFGTQLSNHGQTAVGLQLSIPIFSRFETRNQVKLARIELDQRKLGVADAKKTLYKEMQQAYYNAMSAQQKFVSAQKSLDASSLAFKYAQEKFDAGRATVFEMNEVQKRLIASQAELAQARYEYIFRSKLLDYYMGKPITL